MVKALCQCLDSNFFCLYHRILLTLATSATIPRCANVETVWRRNYKTSRIFTYGHILVSWHVEI